MRFGDPILGHGVLPADQTDHESPQAPVAGTENTNRDTPNVVVSGWQIYDNKRRVVEKYEPFFSAGWDYGLPSDQQRREKAIMFYDPRGQVVRTVNPDHSEQRVIYGVPTNLDDPPLGPLETAKYRPTPWEAYTYDANDNAGRTHENQSAAAYRHHWNTPSHIVIDGLGRTVLAVQRNRDRPVASGGDLPPVVEYRTRSRYDIRGNLLELVDPLDRVAFTYVYDLANGPLKSDSIDAGIRRSVLDVIGNIIEQRDSKGALILRAYDPLNRPQRVWARNGAEGNVTLREILEYGDGSRTDQDSSERTEQARQNRLGRLHRHYDEAGLLTFDGYDFKGNVIEKARQVIADGPIRAAMDAARPEPVRAFQVDWQPPAGTAFPDHVGVLLDGARYQISVTYDALNRIKTMRYPEDVEGRCQLLRPHYNRAGALAGVTLDGETYVSHIAYNAKGQRTLIAYGNGVMTRYTYDPQTFRLVRLRTERFTLSTSHAYHPSGGLLQDFAYGYDLVGNIIALHDRTPESGIPGTLAGIGALDRSFDYDPLYRLLSAIGREYDAPPPIPPGCPWDDLPRCVDPTRTRPYQQQYEYDPVGNLVRLSHTHFPVGNTGSTVHRRFEIQPNSNRLRTVTVGSLPFAYSYDANGNLVQENTERHFGWDHADRLIMFINQPEGASSPSVEACYLYGADGIRVKKWVRKNRSSDAESTVYIDDIFEYHRWGGIHPGANNRLHVMDNQRRVALIRLGNKHSDDGGPDIQYHLGDHLSSSSLVIGGAAATADEFINREEYFPYGETSFGSFARKRYRFTGKERDEERGVYYHGARYYLPWLARWLSCDPLAMVDGPTLYSYTVNNPVAFIDKTGHYAGPLPAGLGGVTVAGGGAAAGSGSAPIAGGSIAVGRAPIVVGGNV